MKTTTEISLKYLDYIRDKMKLVIPARNGLIEDSSIRADRHGTKLTLLLTDCEVHIDVHCHTAGYLVVLTARDRAATFAPKKPLMFTHQHFDRSQLYEEFKRDFDQIFDTFVNIKVKSAMINFPPPVED